MKKAYKTTYGFSFFLNFSYLFFLIYLSIITMVLTHGLNGTTWFEIIGSFVLFLVFNFIVFMIVNLISKIFTKDTVYLSSDAIYYHDSVIRFNDIYKIYFDCGELGGRMSKGTPTNLVVMGKEHGYINIERPSNLLVFKLMFKFKDKFRINHLKKIILLWPSLTIVATLLISLVISLSNK